VESVTGGRLVSRQVWRQLQQVTSARRQLQYVRWVALGSGGKQYTQLIDAGVREKLDLYSPQRPQLLNVAADIGSKF